MLFSEFPFLRYSFFFLIGVLLYPFIGFLPDIWLLAFLCTIYLIYIVLVIRNNAKNTFSFRNVIPVLAYLQLIFCGVIVTSLKDIKNQKNHLIHFEGQIKSYLAVSLANDDPKPNSIANRVKVLAVKDSLGRKARVNGEVIIYHKREQSILPGDLMIISGMPQLISYPKNPHEFNYQKFMLRQQVGHSHFVGEKFLKVGNVSTQPIEDFFLSLRSRIMTNMDSLIIDSHANQVAKALLLGQKKNLEKEINEAYVTAGAMHVLAVSGLHVGIIYGFFFLFIKPFRLKIWKRVIYLSFIIILIWVYALLTGMSPSVMRAATMFSLMALAQMKSRNPSIFNAIALSALILLLYDPFLIYSVGFQLSYLALTGILLIQPILVKLWDPKSKIVDYVWQISTVGIAAQLMTFPISAYYFHVFPTYFILSNLIVIPGAFLIMAFGVPFMLFSEIKLLAVPLAWMTEKLICLVNFLIFKIQDFPYSKIDEIFLKVDFMIVYWVILTLVLLLCIKPHKYYLYSILFVLLVNGAFGVIKVILKPDSSLVIYSTKSGLSIDYKGLYFFDHELDVADLEYKVLPNRKANEVNESLPMVWFDNEKEWLVPLPDQKEYLKISKSKHFIANTKLFAVHKFVNDQWETANEQDSLRIGETAYKLRFKE
ncbi:competence protein ComEC family protein [Belliella sp. DSM 107340]|uniref:Competence protein ComEC family protein n=1 Tax=Belliella calami TaxID=2923436 RepID=A0ABS9URP1_9BACT|nr:ComEC/Rec2 family competence protein [Belliella calami]MCH7399291.1 competence protein ComEC family protein [Belliella calami]